jgi:hypothetical protein
MFSMVMSFLPIHLHSHVRCIWLHQVTIVHVKIAVDMWVSLHACIRAVSSTTDSSSSDSRTGIVKWCPEGFPRCPIAEATFDVCRDVSAGIGMPGEQEGQLWMQVFLTTSVLSMHCKVIDDLGTLSSEFLHDCKVCWLQLFS